LDGVVSVVFFAARAASCFAVGVLVRGDVEHHGGDRRVMAVERGAVDVESLGSHLDEVKMADPPQG
jgi:uncharacterized protein YaiE (UPF0345 family)